MTNIARRLGLAQKITNKPTSELVEFTRNIGVEIEVENVDPNLILSQLGNVWDVVQDGSLRPADRSAELRSPTPGYAGKDLINSIDILDKHDSLVSGSFGWRTALHIHVDMRDKTDEDLLYTYILYSLIEPFIFAWEGNGRHESRFCMPWWVCTGDVTTAIDIIHSRNNDEFHHNIGRFSKYTALNLASLRKFGTIEFRHPQSTINKTKILEYINMCLDIANASKKCPNVSIESMILEFLIGGPEEFIPKWFSNRTTDVLMRAPIGPMPLTQDIFDRSISTALTLSGLYKHGALVVPDHVDSKILNLVM